MSNTNAIRDPVHGWIKFSNAEQEIINSPFVQRLRWITQLSMADQAFPGGVHTRFIHSLGVMKLAGQYMKHLLSEFDDDRQKNHFIRLARIAGLLHDIGHGPFSHSYDTAIYSQIYGKDVNSHYPDGGHDLHRLQMVKHPSLSSVIEKAGITVNELIAVWTAKPNDGMNYIIKTVVGGPLGADRMDFVLRDSYFTGTRHLGTIAAKRIMTCSYLLKDTAASSEDKWYLVYKEKCFHDIIQALDGRKFMYHDVYFHKTSLGATILLDLMLKSCAKDLQLLEETRNLEQFMFVNEHTLIGRIMALPEEHPAKINCKKLMLRHIPKCVKDMVFNVDADPQWNEDKWKKEHPEDKELHFIRTRPITGIDPKKFDQYNIRFEKWQPKTRKPIIETCQDILNRTPHSTMNPYYIVRGYRLTV